MGMETVYVQARRRAGNNYKAGREHSQSLPKSSGVPCA